MIARDAPHIEIFSIISLTLDWHNTDYTITSLLFIHLLLIYRYQKLLSKKRECKQHMTRREATDRGDCATTSYVARNATRDI